MSEENIEQGGGTERGGPRGKRRRSKCKNGAAGMPGESSFWRLESLLLYSTHPPTASVCVELMNIEISCVYREAVLVRGGGCLPAVTGK